MSVREDVVENDSGEELLFGVVHKEPFALIIPWDGKRFVLVGQYRYPVNYFSWEFPQGHLEHDSIEETANRELEEETGLKAGKIQRIGSFFLAPGHHTQECVVFLATDLKIGHMKREKGETGMKIQRYTYNELSKSIREGIIKDSPTITAVKIFDVYKGN